MITSMKEAHELFDALLNVLVSMDPETDGGNSEFYLMKREDYQKYTDALGVAVADPEFMITCPACGEATIEVPMWVDVNTGETYGDYETDESWCRSCEAHIPNDDIEW
jgi:hypothetical protein